MDRTERLLDLVALLLDTREPITWAELREHFPDDYGSGTDEAAERKFERDKAELLELGIPLTWVQGDDDRKDGYLVDREAYYLPEVGLTPEELAVLYAAGSAALASGAFPGQQDLAHALRKIGFFSGRELPTPKVRMELGAAHENPQAIAGRLEQLWAAASARKFVELSYGSPRKVEVTRRRVDVYGLALRRGTWSVVGFCHLRQGIRTFHVHRIRDLEVNSAKPRSADFEVPSAFRLDDYVGSHSWQHRLHEPVEVILSLRGELASLSPRLFPDEPSQPGEGEALVTVRATYLDGLLRYALSLGAECQVRAPERAVARHRELAQKVIRRHKDSAVSSASGGAQ
ncbi:MAG: WYL domain-containing protein [Myxococcaceae bacterium]